MKKRLLITILILTLTIVVATVVVTGAVPLGSVVLRLDKEIYHPNDTVTITLRSLRTGIVEFGARFAVERFEDGNWVEVPSDRLWRLNLIILGPGKAFRQSFIPAEDLSEIPEPGRYRVVKEIQVGPIYCGAALETQILCAEFLIEAPMSEQQGTDS